MLRGTKRGIEKGMTVPKAVASDVTIAIGMLSMTGSIYSVTDAENGKKEAVHLLCPDCASPTEFVEQVYRCKDNAKHGPYEPNQLARGQKIGDKIVKVDAEKLAEARASVLPEKELALQVHSRDAVGQHTFARGNAYVFTPSHNAPLYGILIEILTKRPDICLVAKTNLRKKDHLVMVEVGMNGQLVVRELIWPEDFREFAAPQYEAPNPKYLKMTEELLEASMEDFNEDEYKKESRARVAEVVEEAAGAPTPKGKKKPAAKKVADDDMTALLEAAIKAQKGKKKTA